MKLTIPDNVLKDIYAAHTTKYVLVSTSTPFLFYVYDTEEGEMLDGIHEVVNRAIGSNGKKLGNRRD